MPALSDQGIARFTERLRNLIPIQTEFTIPDARPVYVAAYGNVTQNTFRTYLTMAYQTFPTILNRGRDNPTDPYRYHFTSTEDIMGSLTPAKPSTKTEKSDSEWRKARVSRAHIFARALLYVVTPNKWFTAESITKKFNRDSGYSHLESSSLSQYLFVCWKHKLIPSIIRERKGRRFRYKVLEKQRIDHGVLEDAAASLPKTEINSIQTSKNEINPTGTDFSVVGIECTNSGCRGLNNPIASFCQWCGSVVGPDYQIVIQDSSTVKIPKHIVEEGRSSIQDFIQNNLYFEVDSYDGGGVNCRHRVVLKVKEK